MVSIHSHLAEGRVTSVLRVLRFLNLNHNLNPNLSRQSEVEMKIRSKIMIKRKISVLAGCSMVAFCAMATISHGAGSDAQFDHWFEVQTNLHSWSADFT